MEVVLQIASRYLHDAPRWLARSSVCLEMLKYVKRRKKRKVDLDQNLHPRLGRIENVYSM